MEAADFGGYATKAGLRCSDGRTITNNAFQHMDGVQVPLVWQHGHNNPENVLGHVILEAREDGVYSYGFFNDTKQGQNAKALVEHKDVNALSIYANQLVEKAKQVLHGMICEVSLSLKGANPGALIDYIAVEHSDGEIETLADEAIIHTGLELDLVHADSGSSSDSGPTLRDVYDTLSEEQKNLVHYMVGVAASGEEPGDLSQSATETTEGSTEEPPAEGTPAEGTTEGENLNHQEGNTTVTHNVFEQNGAPAQGERPTLTHDAIKGIVASAQKSGSMKEAVEEYALAHGINDIDLLFPDAKAVMDRPEFDKRRTEWVAGVLNGTRHTPFSRIKSLVADLTLDEARAKGYVKGSLKKEEWFGLTKRTTTPTTVYKKQKLDRDDIIDITDLDVVAWMKFEMRLMLDEELAVAVLIGDGREVDDEDKIKDPAGATDGAGIRSILNDDDLYAAIVNVNLLDASSSYLEFVDAVIKNRRHYKGTGTPTLYTTELHISEMLTLRDGDNRRIYRNLEELANDLRVSSIVPVEAMEREPDVVAIMVNLQDYSLGADKGGEVSMFDDFDIDYNQYKYLIETRLSGALTKIRSALVFKATVLASVLITPASPTQLAQNVTIVNTANVTYKVKAFDGVVTYNGTQVAVGTTVTASFPIVLADGTSVTVEATPTNPATHHFATNVEDEWTFTFDA